MPGGVFAMPTKTALARVDDVEKGVRSSTQDTRGRYRAFALRVVKLVFMLSALACGVVGVYLIPLSSEYPAPLPVVCTCSPTCWCCR